MSNVAAPAPVLHAQYPSNRGAVSRTDDPLSTVTFKTITGHVYDVNGTAVVGATVVLYRQSGDLMVATTTSGPGGTYSFFRRSDDTKSYYVVAYSVAGGATQVHGVSNRGLVPA